MKLSESKEVLKVKFVEGGSGVTLPFYDGEYTIIPKTKDIILPTKSKAMKNDVTIKQIPYKEVQNEGGGSTITIGLE